MCVTRYAVFSQWAASSVLFFFLPPSSSPSLCPCCLSLYLFLCPLYNIWNRVSLPPRLALHSPYIPGKLPSNWDHRPVPPELNLTVLVLKEVWEAMICFQWEMKLCFCFPIESRISAPPNKASKTPTPPCFLLSPKLWFGLILHRYNARCLHFVYLYHSC